MKMNNKKIMIVCQCMSCDDNYYVDDYCIRFGKVPEFNMMTIMKILTVNDKIYLQWYAVSKRLICKVYLIRFFLIFIKIKSII